MSERSLTLLVSNVLPATPGVYSMCCSYITNWELLNQPGSEKNKFFCVKEEDTNDSKDYIKKKKPRILNFQFNLTLSRKIGH